MEKIKQKKNYSRFCCVPHCIVSDKTSLSFHKPPHEKGLQKKWLSALKMVEFRPYMLVCSRHFTRNDYFHPGMPATRHALKKNAVPSQHLPVTFLTEQRKNSDMVLKRAERVKRRAAGTLFTQGKSSFIPNRILNVLADKLTNTDGSLAVPSLNLEHKECSESSLRGKQKECENVSEPNNTKINAENSENQFGGKSKTDNSTKNPSFYLLEHLPTVQTIELSPYLKLNVSKDVSNEFACEQIVLNEPLPTVQAVELSPSPKDVSSEFTCEEIVLNEHQSTVQAVELSPPKLNVSEDISNELACEQIVLSESLENSHHGSTISTTINEQMCRLCLEEKPDMWSFFSVLTFEDKSTLDIVQAFQVLTTESVEQIENPKLPKLICKTCVDLLVNAHAFREKYQKTTQILTDFLSKENDVQDKDLKQEIDKDLPSPEQHDDVHSDLADEDSEVSADESEEFVEELEDLNITSNQSAVKEHVTTTKFHRCPICLKEFTALKLKQHCRTHAALKKYLNAAPKFNKKVRFYATSRTRNVCLFYRENVSHTCPFCAEEFDGEQFREHVNQHRAEGNFKCNVCNRIFIGRNHLKMHQLSHRQEAPFKCTECGKEFFRQKNFDFHKLRHASPEDLPFKCQYCDRTFSNPEHLKRHSFSHEKFVTYQEYYKRSSAYMSCKQCRQKFKSSDDLQSHNCRFCCAKCHKIFDSKKEFTAHVCKYKLKASKCDPCGKVFQLSSSSSAHKTRCAYKTLCYVCGKNVSNITQHLRSHYPQKRGCFICAQCGKQFGHKMHLTRHVKEVHTDVLTYRCQYCSKGFKSKWNLTVHERIHYAERKHLCNICGKGFLEKSYLKKHLKVHSKVNFKREVWLAKQKRDDSIPRAYLELS